MPEDRPLIGLRRGVIGLHYGLKLRWIRFDSVPVLEWIVITGSLDWAKNASGPGIAWTLPSRRTRMTRAS